MDHYELGQRHETVDAPNTPAESWAAAVVIRQGYDVVMGSRFLGDAKTEMSLLRRAILKLAANVMNRGEGTKLTDAHNGLRLVSRQVVARVRLSHAGMAYASELEYQLTRPE